MLMNTGHQLAGRPSMGSWVTYGLGTENRNLPGFVRCVPGYPVMGPRLWSSGFLPNIYQGTYVPNNERTAGEADPEYPQPVALDGRAGAPASAYGPSEPPLSGTFAGTPQTGSGCRSNGSCLPDADGSSRGIRISKGERVDARPLRRLRTSVADVYWRGGWWSAAFAWYRCTSATRSRGTATKTFDRTKDWRGKRTLPSHRCWKI